MSTATYRVTNETRAALEEMVDELIDVAAQGNAPFPSQVVTLIEQILDEGVYHGSVVEDE